MADSHASLRKTWVVLGLLGLVPVALFYLLDATGCTESLRFVATTSWQPGSPSILDLVVLFLSMICWAWVRGLAWLFLLAAAPFFIIDTCGSLRKRVGRPSKSLNL